MATAFRFNEEQIRALYNRGLEPGPDGALQTVLPGAERLTQAALAQRRANAPLKPKAIQRPCDVGLFSDEADQLDLVEMFQTEED